MFLSQVRTALRGQNNLEPTSDRYTICNEMTKKDETFSMMLKPNPWVYFFTIPEKKNLREEIKRLQGL